MRGSGILAAGAVVLALAASGPVGAAPVTVENPPLRTEFEVSPKALPKRTAAPAGLRFSTRLPTSYASGAPAPPAREITLLLDRNLVLDFSGYPVCKSNRLESPLPGDPLPAWCKEAIVGRGSANFEIRFPESEPVAQSSRLLLINGHRDGRAWTLYAHTEITVPVPADIVTTVKVKPIRTGRYGTQLTMTFPKVAGGSGSLTHLAFKLDKRFRREGRKVSVVNAKCPDGKLLLGVETEFSDGTDHEEELVKPCTGKEG